MPTTDKKLYNDTNVENQTKRTCEKIWL